MKIFFHTIFLSFFFISHAQNDELVKLALSDKSNFEIMSWLEENKKMPKRLFLFDTTHSWNSNRFRKSGKYLGMILSDEHHPYPFLFKDSTLGKTFSFAEREKLLETALFLTPRKLRIETSIAQTVTSLHVIKPGDFILWVSEPIYSTDSNYAFLDFTILQKREGESELNESYHSTVCLVYQQENNGWKRIKVINHIIL